MGAMLIIAFLAHSGIEAIATAAVFAVGTYILFEKIFKLGAILTLTVIAIRILQPYKTIHKHYFVCSNCKHYLEDPID